MPTLREMLEDLNARFPRGVLDPFDLAGALFVVTPTPALVGALAKITGASAALTAAELEQWIKVRPKQADGLTQLKSCDGDIFPLMKQALQIINTMFVSVAHSERSFSLLRRVKTWLRGSMGQMRLSSLSITAMNRELAPDVERIITMFAEKKRRIAL